MGRKIGAILSFLTLFLEIFTALLFTPFLIRSFGQAEYGVYTLVISITSYLTLLDLGVGNSVVRFMAKYRTNGQEEEQRKFLGTTLIYYVIIALIAGIIGGIIIAIFPSIYAKGLTREEIELAQTLLFLTVINIVFTLATSSFFNSLIAYENYIVSKGLTIVSTLIRVAIGFWLLLAGYKSVAIVTVNVSLSIFSRLLVVLFVLCKMKLRPQFKGIRFSQVKEIVSYSGIILLQMIATQINSMADQVLIGAFVSSASVVLAVYAVGSQICQYLNSFGGAINGVLMPGVVRMVETNDTPEMAQAEMTRIGRLNFMFLAFIWCVFAVYGYQFICLWAGEINREAYFVAVALMIPHVLILTQSIGTQILWAKNKHKVQAILKFIIVLVNVVLTIILIQWNALYGAVIGTVISLILGDILVMQIVFKKDIGISLTRYYKDLLVGILPALIIATLIGLAVRMLNLTGWLGFLINCFIMTAAYFICMLLFGWNQSEKNMLKNILKKKSVK